MTDIPQKEKEDLFLRQGIAGDQGIEKLTQQEENKIAKINLEKATGHIKSDIIPHEINELLKKQANAGQLGQPNLTETEKETLRKFYKSRS